MTRGRFAPSPTGRLHLGLARTALLAWLGARAEGGVLVMRVEDLDTPRVVPGAAEAQLADLRWLGLDWDEGPDVGGAHGPYLQSQRFDRYDAAIERLRSMDRIYPCTCSRKEVLASAPHGPGEYGAIYPGTCRSGPTHPEREASLRFRVDDLPGFVDGVQGPVDQPGARGDFVVRRADGLYSYQLAVVVDDIEMGIDQVVRGADLLGCTGWQLALHDALGAPPPRYCHVPLMLDADGERLAKRHGGIAVSDYRDAGWSSERVVGALAAGVGLVPPGGEHGPVDLLAGFSWDRSPAQPTRLAPEGLA